MDWNLYTYGAQMVEDSLWFSNNTFNSMFRMKTSTTELEHVDMFPDEEIVKCGLHKKCLCYKNKLLFLPAYGNHIHVYSIDSQTMQSFKYDEDNSKRTIDRISDACIVEDVVFIFPINMDGDLKAFYPDYGIIEVVPEFKEQIKILELKEKLYLLTRVEKDNSGNIIFAFYGSDILAKWNVTSRKLYTERTEVHSIFSSHVIGKDRWIITTNTDSIYCVGEDGYVKEYKGTKRVKLKDRLYNRILKFYSNVIILPAFDDSVYAIKNDRIVEIAKVFPVDINKIAAHSFETCIVNGDLWILPFESSDGIIIGRDLSIKDRVSFELKDEILKKTIMKEHYYNQSNNGIIHESNNNRLENFVKIFTG